MSVTKTISNDKKKLTISVQGTFDFTLVHDFRDSYTDVEPKPEEIVLDFQNIVNLDSSALGMLLNLKRYMEFGDLDIKIVNARSEVKKILQIAHFEKMFQIT